MKNIIITMILCFAGFISIGQSAEWKVIGSPDTAGVEILVLTNANELVGFNHFSQKLLYSNNDGKTWTSIIEKFDFYSYQYLPLKSSSKNEIYFFEAHFLYKP